MPLDLLLPGLLPPRDAPPEMRAARLPAVERWLARADLAREAAGPAHDWLARAYGLALPPPVAAVTLASESEIREGTWVRADPVHVRIEGARTSMHAGAALGIEAAEARALAAALQAHFRADGLEVVAPSPTRWYVRVPPGEVPESPPLEGALAAGSGKDLPASPGRINWRTALTEAQMVLATHEVNAAREAARRPAINSIWLWGGGGMPSQLPRAYGAVRAEDPFARGLGLLSGAALGSGLDDLGDEAAGEGPTLAMEGALADAIERGDGEGWLRAAQALDRRLERSASRWIERFGRLRLVMPSPGATLVASLDAGSRWRIFRARRSLEAYA